MRDRLEEHAGDRRVLDAEADDRAHLMLVDAALDGGGKRDADFGRDAAIERAELLLGQRPTAERNLRRLLEAVELQVDVDSELCQSGREAGIASQADAIRVQHHQRDVAPLGGRQHVEDLRVDRGLTAGELNRLGFALGPDEGVQHRLDLLQRQAVPVLLRPRAGVGEADRAVEVAGGVDLDDPQAGVLGVLGADATVTRAAVKGLRLTLAGVFAGLVEALDLQIALGVAVDDRLEFSVVGAPTAEDHAGVANEELGIEHGAAARTDRLGVAQRPAGRGRRVARRPRGDYLWPGCAARHALSDRSITAKGSSTQIVALSLNALAGQEAEIGDDEWHAVVQAGFHPGERVGVSLDDHVELVDRGQDRPDDERDHDRTSQMVAPEADSQGVRQRHRLDPLRALRHTGGSAVTVSDRRLRRDRGSGPRLRRRLLERLAGANWRRDQRCPYEDQGERRDPHAYQERVVPEPVSEDRQPGDDRGQVRRDRGDGDHGDAVADLEAAGGRVEREDRRRDDDHAPGAEEARQAALEVSREPFIATSEIPNPSPAAMPSSTPRWAGMRSIRWERTSSRPTQTAMPSKTIIPARE